MNWLRNWWRKKSRRIFIFWDGKKIRRVDPIVIYRGLRASEHWDMDNDLDFWVKGREEATLRCVAATRDAFGIAAYDGSSGLTEDETLDVLAGFLIWVDKLKKNSSPLPISPEPTVPPPPSSDSGTTKPSADCTSTLPELSTAGPPA